MTEMIRTSTPTQIEFAGADYRKKKELIKKLCKEHGEKSNHSTPVSIKPEFYEDNGIYSDKELKEKADYIRVNSRGAIYNLLKCKSYYYKGSNDHIFKCRTDDNFPRWISAPGTFNVRDLGDKRIKQGVAFRGARLETLIDSGKDALKALGIKAHLDLRKEAVGKFDKSPLGDGVKYSIIPIEGYMEFTALPKEKIVELFEFLADENNYPLYFSCHGGQDRTGMVAFFIKAICGVGGEELIDDYEQTMLSFPDKKLTRSRNGVIKPFLKFMKKLGKGSVSEGSIKFLRDCGVTDETMEKIRKIYIWHQ